MLFNSYVFIFAFLPVAFLGYFILNHYRLVFAAKAWLFMASLFFYSWWNIAYLPLLLGSVLFNFTIASQMNAFDEQSKNPVSKKALFVFALTVNVGFLAYFKYMDFFIDNFNFALGTDMPLLHLALPLAISFFTLQQIAFLVDVYEGLAKEQKFIDYALFVSFFPQLIAGPIVHHQKMMPQFETLRSKIINPRNIALGIFIFSIGLFKKVVIADTFAIWATESFDEAAMLTFFPAWGASLSYTFQLYFDFSGYTDMAIGLGLLFNIKLPANFNSPLKATGVVDFWARWHITLTNFITTYLFTPILQAFPKMTFRNSMIAIFIAMTIAGLWHGAAWTFVIFGMVHGLGIVVNHNWKKRKKKMPHWLAWFITFNFANLAFVIFRARDLGDAFKVYEGMFGFNGIVFPDIGVAALHGLTSFGITVGSYMTNDNNLQLLMILAAFVVVKFVRNSMELMESFAATRKAAVYTALLFVISVFGMSRISEFIYFNF